MNYAENMREINAGTEKVLNDHTPYSGAINLAARTYAMAQAEGRDLAYLAGMGTMVMALIGAYLDFPDPEVTGSITTRVLVYWMEWVREHPDA